MPRVPRLIAILGRLLVCTLMAMFCVGCERDPLPPDIPDSVAPLPPADLQFESNSDGMAILSWLLNSEPDVDHYEIWRSEQKDSSNFAAVGSSSRYWFIDTWLSYDSTYYYYVTAVDKAGNASPRSNIVRLTSPNRHLPDPPREPNASGRNDAAQRSVLVSWTWSGDFDVAGYRIYRSVSPLLAPDSTLRIAQTQEEHYLDTSASVIGRTYHYLVTTLDRGGYESSSGAVASDLITGRPELLSPIEGARIPTYTVFEWMAAPGAVQYRFIVSYSGNAGDIWSTTIASDGSATQAVQYTGPALTPGMTYLWRVIALSKSFGPPNGISDSRSFIVTP